MRKCIGCDKESEEPLCEKCEKQLIMVFDTLKDNGIQLKLESVTIKK